MKSKYEKSVHNLKEILQSLMQVPFMITTLYFTVTNSWELCRPSLIAQNLIHHGHIFRDIDFDEKSPQYILKPKSSPKLYILSFQGMEWNEANTIILLVISNWQNNYPVIFCCETLCNWKCQKSFFFFGVFYSCIGWENEPIFSINIFIFKKYLLW